MDVSSYLKEFHAENTKEWLEEGKVTVSYFGRAHLYKMFAAMGFTKGCEVGVLGGRNAYGMYKYIPNLFLILVDPYMWYPEAQRAYHPGLLNKRFKTMTKVLIRFNYKLLKLPSQEAAKHIKDESLDFVYIDGNHRLEHAMIDLLSWFPKVREGGILSGHDYFNHMERGFGVKDAVDIYVKHYNIKPLYVINRKEKIKHGQWFFVKEKRPEIKI